MGKAVLKNFLPMAKAFSGTNQLLTQVSKILSSQLLEFAAFEQVPHLFLRIELRSIARPMGKRLHLERLPCYAPVLNPQEPGVNLLKRRELKKPGWQDPATPPQTFVT